jgi:hypothetical protein
MEVGLFAMISNLVIPFPYKQLEYKISTTIEENKMRASLNANTLPNPETLDILYLIIPQAIKT